MILVWIHTAYDFIISEYPTILGLDSAGTVEVTGEGVEDFTKGDEV